MTCDECISKLQIRLKKQRQEGHGNSISQEDKEFIDAEEFFDLLKEKMNIYWEMGRLIFNHIDDEKFVFNEFKKLYQLNP
jgi:hypothetical protein